MKRILVLVILCSIFGSACVCGYDVKENVAKVSETGFDISNESENVFAESHCNEEDLSITPVELESETEQTSNICIESHYYAETEEGLECSEEEIYEPVEELKIEAKQAFAYDMNSGVVFLKGDLTERIYPASITKLYTAYVALKYLQAEAIIEVGGELELVAEDSSIAFIERGNRLTVEMLVEGMLLPSGGDAAYVLAAAAGREIIGDMEANPETAVKAFISVMNDFAREDRLENTHFSNPDGYHNENHYSTMEDLITIAKLVLDCDIIRKYTAMYSDKVMYESGETNTWTNTNLLLSPQSVFYREDAIGLKTGYTSDAGHCLLAAEANGDGLVIVGVFGCDGSQQRFEAAFLLLEAFAE